MILRRLTNAFRKQDWFTVAVETLIVVLGVFLGIQLGNWNEGQADMRRGSAYSQRLAIDIQTDIRDRSNLLAYYEAVNDSAERTAALLASSSPDPRELVVNAYRATEYANHQPTRSTWDEIVSSGDIGLLPPGFVEDGWGSYFTDITANNAAQNALASSYRQRVRRTIPHEIQRAIRESCGDKRDEIGNVTGFRADCNLDVPDEEWATAAEALLSDPELLPDLRLHFSNISSARGDLTGSMYSLQQAIGVLESASTGAKRAPAE
ncbi:hypothetical protein [Hyphomonas sp.]|uniref:hypothetical protein n=1 Tax=Hyphomonas sp. TaxID=87 RepID=UPI0030F851C0